MKNSTWRHSLIMPHLAIGTILLLLSVRMTAQTYTMGPESFMSWEDFVAEYIDNADEADMEAAEGSLLTRQLELLEELHYHPFNINTVHRSDLLRVPLLNEAQVDSILAYREKKRLLRSLGELQWISGIPFDTRKKLSLFLYAGDTLREPPSLSSRFLDGRHEIISRLDIPLYQRAGDRTLSPEELQKNPNRSYLGNSLANTTRYRYRWQQDVAYGLTLQKDAGEPFAGYGNYPFDYVSAYLYFRSLNRRFAFWLGDFNIHAGQGLLLGNSFLSSPLQYLENTRQAPSRIRPHTSSDESDFFRGVAATFRLTPHQQLTAFLSYRKPDARIEGDTIRSFPTDGMHRTLNEKQRKHAAGNWVTGLRYQLQASSWHIGTSAYWSQYSHIVYPPLRAYNRYYLRGKSAAGISSDYSWRNRRWTIQGETAFDRKGNGATTHSLRYAPNSFYTFLLQQRSFSCRFVAPFGQSLQEGSHLQNEHALLLGALLRPADRLTATAYAEYFRHPRPTYTADRTSQGMELFAQADYLLRQNRLLRFRYKLKTKEQNITGYDGLMQYVGTHRLRLSFSETHPQWSLNAAADFTAVTRQAAPTTLGWMASARSKIQCLPSFTVSLFGALFFTDDYASRLYAYEPQLPYAAGFPTFAYHGARIAALLQWKFVRNGYLGLKYGCLHYFNRTSISSGTQQIDGPSKNDISVQLAYRF